MSKKDMNHGSEVLILGEGVELGKLVFTFSVHKSHVSNKTPEEEILRTK